MEPEDLELIRTRAVIKALRTQVLRLTSETWKDLAAAGLRGEMEGDWLPHMNRIAEAIESTDLWLVGVQNNRAATRTANSITACEDEDGQKSLLD